MNESRQTVETDIRALNFRKPGHLRKYCNNENFPIYGSCERNETPVRSTASIWSCANVTAFHYTDVNNAKRANVTGSMKSTKVETLGVI